MENQEPTYAIVELFGHQTIAGKVSSQEFGGASFMRVDVAATSKKPAFTKSFGAKAVYAINWCDEETATAYANQLDAAPIQNYQVRAVVSKMLEEAKGIEAADVEDEELPWDSH